MTDNWEAGSKGGLKEKFSFLHARCKKARIAPASYVVGNLRNKRAPYAIYGNKM